MKMLKSRKKFIAKVVLVAAIVSATLAATVATAKADNSATSHGVHVVGVTTHSVDIGWRGVGQSVPDEILVYDASTLQLVVHTSIEAGHNTDRVVELGNSYQGRALQAKVAYVIGGHNTGWSAPVTFYVQVANGSPGATGPQGPAGPRGPSGVVKTHVYSLLDTPVVINTGGSFLTHEQLAGEISNLHAGTYLVTVNLKAAWASGNGVFPQLFVYSGTPAGDFSNDLFNAGNGALAQGNASIDSYYGGTTQLVIPEHGNLKVYLFGYDQDHGAGSYNGESVQVILTQLVPAV
jgi:hypothetical protein